MRKITKAFLTDSISLAKKCKNIDMLYFGDEFCQNKIPSLTRLKYAYELAKSNNMKFAFVLPFMTDSQFDFADVLLKYLGGLNDNIEAVFNDWGTFLAVSKYKNLKPVLGRLLTKQRKDPAAQNILDGAQQKIKMIFENNEKILIRPKKIPDGLKRYFQKTFADVPHVMDFMISNNIKRYELDLLPWGNKLKTGGRIKTSVYYPYINISATRYCGAVNLDYSSKCSKICRKQKIEIGSGILKYPYVIIGNAIFYKAGAGMLQKELKNSGADRIVINDFRSLNDF